MRKRLPKYVIEYKGKWYVRLYVPLEHGYRQIKRLCDPQTEEQAELVTAFIRQQLEPQREIATVSEYLTHYLESKKHSVSQKVYESHSGYIERFIGTLGQMNLEDVTPRDVQRLYSETGATPSVLRQFHKVLSAAFGQAVLWGDLKKNPCKHLLLPKVRHKEILPLTETEARRFIEYCRKDISNVVLEFALESGARPQEYLALKWSDIQGNLVTIQRAVVFGVKKTNFLFKDPKTKNSRRTIPISPALVDRLAAHKKTLKGKMRKSGLVFPSRAGTPMSLNSLNRWKVKPAIKEIGLPPRYSAYSLRHTAITLLLPHADIKTIADRCGTSPEMIWARYGHSLPSRRTALAEKLSEVLYGTI